MQSVFIILPLLLGWFLDLFLGDPAWLPHPVVGFGKMIAFGERRLNKGTHRKLKGALMAIVYIIGVFVAAWFLRTQLSIMHYALSIVFDVVVIFFCLAGTTLIHEVRQVFLAVDRSLDEGRQQVARIVGRDTSELSAQEVRTAALDMLLGVPGMMAYKMVNTLDSMIGYKTDRYRDFGCWAAHIDDIANYIPARLTALLMILPSLLTFHFSLFTFVRQNGRNHASPNSGYPEAALAGILNCRFGGPHYYFGQLFDKPYIGTNDRPLTTEDMKTAVRVNRTAEVLMIVLVAAVSLI